MYIYKNIQLNLYLMNIFIIIWQTPWYNEPVIVKYMEKNPQNKETLL